MIRSRLHPRHENWRALPPPPVTQPHLNTRPMLACADGSFLPLIAKYHVSPHAHVFELDATLCPDVELAVRKARQSPVHYTVPTANSHSESLVKAGPARHGSEIRGGRLGLVADGDYQERISVIVADKHRRASIMPYHVPGVSGILTSHRATLSAFPTTNGSKEYCTYWIRRGECDYVQQGCRYKHEMPSLDKLKEIGFKEYPKWWQEKLQYSRPNVMVRTKRDTDALKRMIDAHLGYKAAGERMEDPSDETESRSAGSVELVVPSVRQRIVVTPDKLAALAADVCKPSTTSRTALASTPSRQQVQPIDLLDGISDSESDSLQIALKAPLSSPELSSSCRQGRFVPYNERGDAPEAPSCVELRSPSPLLLESKFEHVDVVPPNTPVLSTKLASPDISRGTLAAETPVGYLGKANGFLKSATSHDVTSRHQSNTQLQQIEELGAKISALQQKTTPIRAGKGLYKSKYARLVKSSSAEVAGLRPSPPPAPRKTVNAKAVAGLQNRREKNGRMKESVLESTTDAKNVGIAIQPRPQLVKGYRHLYDQGA